MKATCIRLCQIENILQFFTHDPIRNLHLSIPILRLLLMSGQVVKFDCEVIDSYEPPPASSFHLAKSCQVLRGQFHMHFVIIVPEARRTI